MYPIRLKLHGIRDFSPLSLDLGGAGDHVLIGGKNGSGKSTLVYAMAFALVSARVSVDGLRSKLKKKGVDGWQARVTVLFHNPPGPEQKDAPEYVELAAEVFHMPGSERRRVIYSLHGGEAPDKLNQLRRFQTRAEAFEYYKRVFNIDAEGYFMFWYQGSIADFANISDAERFKRVAEMFGLDEMQREWELAREQMRESEYDFERAKNIALLRKRKLQELEKYKIALEQRNSIRQKALELYDSYYREMLAIVKSEIEDLSARLAEEQKSYQQAAAQRDDREQSLRLLDSRLNRQKQQYQEKQQELKVHKAEIKNLNDSLDRWTAERDKLQKKVGDIRSRMSHIRRTKAELLEERGSLAERIAFLQDNLLKQDNRIKELEDSLGKANQSFGGAETELKRTTSKLEEIKHADRELPQATELEQNISKLENELKAAAETLGVLRQRKDDAEEELKRLTKQKIPLLPGQEEILQKYRDAGVRAAAFGELFDVREGVDREQAEQWLGPLKHTIFVERLLEKVNVPQAFYVVALPAEKRRLWFSAQEKKSNIFEYITVARGFKSPAPDFLARVEKWLSQVELKFEPGAPGPSTKLVLWNNNLWDNFGIRGPVDHSPSIGISAIEQARENARQKLEQAKAQIISCEKNVQSISEQLELKRSLLARRREVDREMPRLSGEKARLEERLDRIGAELENLRAELEKCRENRQRDDREKEQKEWLLKQVEGELAVYAEYESMQDTITAIQQLDRDIARAQEQASELKGKTDRLERELDGLAGLISDGERNAGRLRDELQQLDDETNRRSARVREIEEKVDSLQIEKEELEGKHAALFLEFKEVIENLISTGQWSPPKFDEREKTRANLARKEEEARKNLDEARARVVDEDAQTKYEDFLYEYNQAMRELEESSLRFENLKKREEERRNEFDRSVNNRLQRTNRLFRQYMERLGMVGEVRSIPPDPDARHPVYQWELHVATKLGHKPEKISPETGRTVGEGISGGERAATSLVFALALLSDIEVKPPFYVLDEFDSSLDEERKFDIFNLYQSVLGRKLIIVSPKVHGDQYLNCFAKFHCVVANPGVLPGQVISEVYEVTRRQYREIQTGED